MSIAGLSPSAGPGWSFQHGEADVDLYLEVSAEFLAAAT
jgi:hypothetical protein